MARVLADSLDTQQLYFYWLGRRLDDLPDATLVHSGKPACARRVGVSRMRSDANGQHVRGGGSDGAVGVSVSVVSASFLSLLQKEFSVRKIAEIKFLLH